MTAVVTVSPDNIQVTKWHPIWDQSLAVALEATFTPETTSLELLVDFISQREAQRKNLFYQNEGKSPRIYHPAILKGDSEILLQIDFLPIVDMAECQYLRLCLRGESDQSEIQFAREGEEKSFGFSVGKPPYINLDFQSKCEFRPLFIRRAPGEFFSLIAEEVREEKISLLLSRTDRISVPLHLLP